MLNYEIINDYIKIPYSNKRPRYSVELRKLGESIDWRIVEYYNEPIIVKNVSHWVMHLFVSKNLSVEFAIEFQELIKKLCPENKIDWIATERAIKMHEAYRLLLDDNNTIEPLDILKSLKLKFNIA